MGTMNKFIKKLYAQKRGSPVEIEKILDLAQEQQRFHEQTLALRIPARYENAEAVFQAYDVLYGEVIAPLSSSPTEAELAKAVATLNAQTGLSVQLNKVLEQINFKP